MYFEREIITSRNNQFVKWVSGLSDKKNRKESGYFLAEGVKLTREALEAGLPVDYLIVSDKRKDAVIDELEKFYSSEKYEKTKFVTVSEGVFEKISTEKAPQGVISVIKHLDFFRDMDMIYKEEFFLEPEEKAIFLFSLRDPSNLGAVIRSSVAFGIDHIILSDDCADIYSPKTVRSAMGSIYRVKVTTVKDVKSFIKAAQQNSRRVFAAELSERAVSLHDVGLVGSDIVMIGNEGHGIDPEISALCDGSVYIPISKKTESLNASVAAAIFMWEQSK
jgi:TrmH family RNA methyltransferase